MPGISNIGYVPPHRIGYSRSNNNQARYTQTTQKSNGNGGGAGKVLGIGAAIIGAIALRKPIGKLLAPLGNAISTKAPKLTKAAKSVSGRLGRDATKVSKQSQGFWTKAKTWISETFAPKAREVAGQANDKLTNTILPNVRSAATKVKKTITETVIPNTQTFVQNTTEKARNTMTQKVTPRVQNFTNKILDSAIKWGEKGV